jgi:DNA-binding response OmpR family regulator
LNNLRLEGHLLLVEDARNVRLVISRLIEHSGVSVEACQSGEDALRLSKNTSFDMAIIDLGLPGISGFETLKALRQAGHHFPCLALSGDSNTVNRSLWLELGGQGFISKPVARRKLFDDLERWLAPMGGASGPSGTLHERFVSAMIESNRALHEVVAARDYGKIVEIAHRMKGTCGTFRASEAANAAALVLRCVELENRDNDSLDRATSELAEAIARLSAP